MAHALATVQSSPTAASTQHISVTAPITINPPNGNPHAIAKMVADKLNDPMTYARQTNSGVQ
jgi:hypothetical protein